jgi:hypothetical protein
MTKPIVFRPDRRATRNAAASSFVRAATVALIAAVGRSVDEPDVLARRLYPGERDVGLVLRAATAPASTTQSGWAAELTNVGAITDLLSILAPASAAAAVFAQCLNWQWPTGVSGLSIPTLNVSPSFAAWIGQSSPYPVVDFVSSRVTVTPKKIGTIATFTREMFQYSTPAIEQLVRLAIAESLGLALDSRLFSSTAADSVSPPGLFAGISPLTASTATIPSEAMAEDLANVIASVSSVAANAPIVLVAAPRQAAAIRVRTDIDYQTYSSSVLPDKTIVALATNAFVSVGDLAPQFETALEAVFHSEASAPAPIGTPGTPNVVAAPTVSAWQQDVVALKMKFAINWTLRSPSGVAYLNNVGW